MLRKLEVIYFPKSVSEACKLLKDKHENHVILAGGTHLGVIDDSSVKGLVDLKNANLSYIRKEKKEFRIGSMTPVQDIFKSEILTGPSGKLLQSAAGKIGSTLLRHAITIGGNIAAVFSWCDLPPALLALDATIVVHDGKKERGVSAEQWFHQTPGKHLKAGELVSEIRIPEFGKETGTAFHKFAKTKNDYSMITVAVRINKEKGKVQEARIALSAISRQPLRCSAAENLLTGKKPDARLLETVAEAAGQGLVLTADIRASKAYRSEVLPVFVRRCLEEASK